MKNGSRSDRKQNFSRPNFSPNILNDYDRYVFNVKIISLIHVRNGGSISMVRPNKVANF